MGRNPAAVHISTSHCRLGMPVNKDLSCDIRLVQRPRLTRIHYCTRSPRTCRGDALKPDRRGALPPLPFLDDLLTCVPPACVIVARSRPPGLAAACAVARVCQSPHTHLVPLLHPRRTCTFCLSPVLAARRMLCPRLLLTPAQAASSRQHRLPSSSCQVRRRLVHTHSMYATAAVCVHITPTHYQSLAPSYVE